MEVVSIKSEVVEMTSRYSYRINRYDNITLIYTPIMYHYLYGGNELAILRRKYVDNQVIW